MRLAAAAALAALALGAPAAHAATNPPPKWFSYDRPAQYSAPSNTSLAPIVPGTT